jgi:hypothetical protein
MAAQRITFAKVAGQAAAVIHQLFVRWIAASEGSALPDAIRAEIDDFATNLRAHAATPPGLYFSEWVDMWSMGDIVPNLGSEKAPVATGNRVQACCHVAPIQFEKLRKGINVRLAISGEPAQEATWLVARLREAEDACGEMAGDNWVLVVLREVLGLTVTDEEVQASLQSVPKWLDQK